jgi:hypothetical protein
MKRLFNNFVSTVLALATGITSIVVNPSNAKAGEVRVISKNGIALNANPTYGYKHGAMKVSQYLTSNYFDNEQRWEVIPIGSGKSLLRNVEYNKCLNSYQTQVGSTPNLFACDTNDIDQKVILNGDTITHAATGLQLNLGDRNDTPVVWKQAYISSNSKILGFQNQQPEVKDDWSQNRSIFNLCLEVSSNVFDQDGIYIKSHLNQCGKLYYYMNKDAANNTKAMILNTLATEGFLTSIGIIKYGSVGQLFAKVGPVGTLYAAGVTFAFSRSSIEIDRCINDSRSKGLWIDTSTALLNTSVRCDY